MKTSLLVMVATFGSVLASQVSAQSFKTLYSFPNGAGGGSLTLSGDTLERVASTWSNFITVFAGSAFAVKTECTGFRTLVTNPKSGTQQFFRLNR
jgi:hypothetical protein